MFKHLFKLIWNKKKQNFLLISEILISFMVIFAVFTMVVYYYQNYKKPMGIGYENIWAISYNNTLQTKNTDSLDQYYATLSNTIKAMPQVQGVSYTSDNVPFFQNISEGMVSHDKKRVDHVNWYRTGDTYKDVLNIQLLEGRWFDKTDGAAKNQNVVINQSLREEMFGKGPAIGKLLGDYDFKNTMKIVGVVQDVKAKGDYAAAGYAVYERLDTGSFRSIGRILVKVPPAAMLHLKGSCIKPWPTT